MQPPWPEGTRWELIERGPIQMVPSPDFDHQRVSGHGVQASCRLVGKHGALGVLPAPFDVVLPVCDVVQPVGVVVAPSEVSREMKRFEGVPRVVVVILSESNRRRDDITKYRVYEQAGVPEYWIVDPELPRICVYAHAMSAEHGRPRDELQGSDAHGVTASPTSARHFRLVFNEPLGYRLESDEQSTGVHPLSYP